MFGESLQPTASELFASIAAREALLRHGPGLVEFNLAYLARNDETNILSTRPDTPVTPEIAEKYKNDFKGIIDNPAIDKRVLKDATGLSWVEVNKVSMYLEQVTGDLPDGFIPMY